MFENNRTEFARDCGVEQAHRFQVVMSGEQDSELPSEELYWGSFTTLPQVEDTFTDAESSELCRPVAANDDGQWRTRP